MQQRLLAERPPAHARLLDAEVREDVLDDPLQVTELDRRPGALRPARRPGTVQEDRKGAALLPAPLRVQAVPLADLERADEAGAEAEVGAQRAHQAGDGRAAQLARLR